MRLESSAAGYICNIICDKLFMASYLIQFFNLKHTFHHYIYIDVPRYLPALGDVTVLWWGQPHPWHPPAMNFQL